MSAVTENNQADRVISILYREAAGFVQQGIGADTP